MYSNNKILIDFSNFYTIKTQMNDLQFHFFCISLGML